LKLDPRLSIFKHIQEVFEDSRTTLSSVVPITYLTSPQRQNGKITEDSRSFSAKQVEALLVMAFFCTFPFRNSGGEMPGINFNTLYEAMNWGSQRHQAAKAKMDCIWQYFATRTYEDRHMRQERKIEFKRQSMRDFPTWGDSKNVLSSVTFAEYPMEDHVGKVLEVDFANKMIGGGILGSGAVQEEIRMAIAPEMIVARLFTAPLEDNEVLFIKGAKRFSRTSGYSNSLKFEEHYKDMEMREVVAMDAREYRDKSQQFKRKEFERELNKAFCGFYSKSGDKTKIATGHWGCGAFGGDKELKAILQLLAASEVSFLEIIFR
jgi:poly(ADP-ribose) glycohydrolase